MPESSIEAAVTAAERDGLRFLLRVRHVVLAAVALWLITPLRLTLGLCCGRGAVILAEQPVTVWTVERAAFNARR